MCICSLYSLLNVYSVSRKQTDLNILFLYAFNKYNNRMRYIAVSLGLSKRNGTHFEKFSPLKVFIFEFRAYLALEIMKKIKKIHLWKFLFKCSVYAETFRNKNSKISLLHAGKLKIFWTLLIYYITNAFAIVSDFGFVNLVRIAVSFTSTSNIFQFGRYIQIYLLVSIHWHFY